MSIRIMVVDDTELNLKMVSAILIKDGYDVVTARNGVEALEVIKTSPPALAILDVMMPDMDGYTLCGHLRKTSSTAKIPIIILTALSGVEDKIKAFDSGADDFLAKPFEPQELRARIKVLLRRVSDRESTQTKEVTGKVISVFSLRGGVGVSMLASNLASSLSLIWGSPAVLVDLAFVNGQSALLMDLPLRNTWADVGRSPASEIDIDMVNSVLLRHDAGVYVLASPRRPEEAEVITAEHVRRVISLLRTYYHYIVLDLPHDFTETTLAGLDMSDQILLMLAPETASVRCAANAIETFSQLEYPPERTKLILNWPFKGKGLPRSGIESALKKEMDVVIPYAGDAVVTSIMYGKPSALQTPLDPLGAFLEDIAYLYSKEDQKQTPPENVGEGLKRVKERAKSRQDKPA
ncbi:MAG: response regulator [Chloroflexi bacterium]|nr:response regulator [Chloroflexota bacterium]